ncbi:MAG TPA: hypothetical protein VHW09_18110 [Bryobacteraceae bacterium]|jgi:hypothetical protein|nr:hypothetical protein [Bryobacteraceae bacterium]
MRPTITGIMLANAALFVFGAVQHAGIAIGPFYEPSIRPASMVETLCALALMGGAVAAWMGTRRAWTLAIAGNLVAIGGVALGMVALAVGAGPRTASNDWYHRFMLALAFAALLLLLLPAGRWSLRRAR